MTFLGARPLIQAPMAGVQGTGLAIAVGRAGAVGSLPAAMLAPGQLRSALAELDAAGHPYNVNFFAHRQPADQPGRAWLAALAPYFAEYGLPEPGESGPGRRPFDGDALEVVASAAPAMVSFHFGLPAADLLAELKRRSRAVIAGSATTVDEARWLVEHGADVVIAQGWEAGGHRGHFLSDDLTLHGPTLDLLTRIRAEVDVPVVAAGGITTPDAVRAAMEAGAAAVQCGTAFLLADEATTSALHRAAIGEPHETVVTTAMTGRPARGIPNRLIRELGEHPDAVHPFPLAAGPLAGLRAAAEASGRTDFTPLWCGESTDGVRAAPAAAIVDALLGEIR